MLDIFKQVQVKRNDGVVASHNRYKLGQMSICFVGSSFCLMAHGKARIQVYNKAVSYMSLNKLKSILCPFYELNPLK